MPAEWKQQGFDPNLLANRLDQIKSVNPLTGEASFRGFGAREIATILHSALNFGERMPEAVQRGIVVDAAFARARAGRITGPTLLREIRVREEQYARRPRERYVLTTSLSFRHLPSLTSTEISGHRVTFGPLPARFRRAYAEAAESAEGQVLGPLPDGGPLRRRYTPVRVSVRARSRDEASEDALDALDLLRGLWNFTINARVGMRLSGGPRKPVNRVVLGPLHSLHRPTGALAEEVPLVEPDYAGPLKPYNLPREWAKLKPSIENARRNLAGSRYRGELEGALRRYVRALDRRDWNTSFVQLWGVLETLTGTSKDRYEVTEKRVLFLVPPSRRDFDRQILRHLTSYRNRTIHAGYETQAIETLLFQLKRFAERCLSFHLWAMPRFDSVKEAASFMDLPPELQRLQNDARLYRRALLLQERLSRF